jgi:hypothetical protein
MRAPATVYTVSPRRYPRPLVQHTFEPFSEVARIDKNGFIKWQRRKVFISSALKYEYVELDCDTQDGWDVRWGSILLGRLNEHRPDRGLIVSRRRRGSKEVSGMSFL